MSNDMPSDHTSINDDNHLKDCAISLQNAPIPFFIVITKEQLIFINHSFAEVLSYPSSDYALGLLPS